MAKHELHQFDLRPAVAKEFVADLELSAADHVFEVGPGLGALTKEILATGAQLYAVEADLQRVNLLRELCAKAIASGQLQLLAGDARSMLPLFDGNWRIIANPPFHHTATFLRQWLLEDLPSGSPQRIDVVLQQQAVEKWLASDQEQTRSSVLLKLWGSGKITHYLDREDVSPPSHVDLCCMRVVRSAYALEPSEMRLVDTLLEIAFAGPHSVREALRKVATPAIFKRQGKQHHWHSDMHPRELPAEAWLPLAQFLRSINKI